MSIAIIDYGLGNLASVAGAVAKLDFSPVITSDPAELERANKLILPGVGAFRDGMRNLSQRSLIAPLQRLVLDERKPILGICLGCQLFAKQSEEFGVHKGLGWIDANVKLLRPSDPSFRIPHVGWDDLVQVGESLLFQDVPPDSLFYYVHSYYLDFDDNSAIVGTCDYGVRFAAAVSHKNIHATQFHPEKSQRSGLTVLANFLARS